MIAHCTIDGGIHRSRHVISWRTGRIFTVGIIVHDTTE